MDYEETMVDNEAEDSLPEEFVEESDDSEEELEEFIGDDEPEEPQEQQPEPEAKEPGYVRSRIEKAVQKALNEQRESLRAEMEAQYAPIRDRLLEMDAQELVRSGEFKSIERAKEYLQLKQGIVPEVEEQPRNERGQFAPKEDPVMMKHIDMLKHQAERIKANGGPDVIAEWNSNPEIKKAVINGEMDFYDVAAQMKPKRRPPSPTRAPNGVNGVGPQSITSMSDAQFRKMDKMLDEGVRFTIKR